MRVSARVTLSVLLFMLSNPGLSGTLEQASFEGQVLMSIDQGQVKSCGVRVLAAVNVNTSQKSYGR